MQELVQQGRSQPGERGASGMCCEKDDVHFCRPHAATPTFSATARVSTGPVVVRLAGRANEREREREKKVIDVSLWNMGFPKMETR